MALVETYLLDYLLDDPEIALRIGHGSPVKYALYPEVLKEETCFPAITYSRITSTQDELLDGNPDLAFATFQLTCWATKAVNAWELAAVLRARMSGIGGNGFQKASIPNVRSGYESDTKLYRSDVDVQIAYAESSPA